MNILECAQAESVFRAATGYVLCGMSVIPLQGKTPAITGYHFGNIPLPYNWKDNQERRADQIAIAAWYKWGWLQNIGLVCGAVSENLIVIDCDGLDAVAAYEKEFPHLLDTFTVLTGSGKGAHYYYRVGKLTPTTRTIGTAIGNVELRSNGCYVVAPPSVHPMSGQRYTVKTALPILEVNWLGDVNQWILKLMREKHGGTLPPPTRPAKPVQHTNRYGATALRLECENVRHAPENTRNNTLNRAAFKLGQLVNRGLLTREEVFDALYAAASGLIASDGEVSVIRTIHSGLDGAGRKPDWRGTNATKE